MAARTLPNLGLKAFFDYGEDGWNDEYDFNMLAISVLTQGNVLDKVAAEPGSPANGDRYILDETHATHPNCVAIRDAGAWVYITPVEGWLLYNRAMDYYEKFSGTAWAELATGGGGGGGASSLDDLDDVDLTTTPPVVGDTLVFDGDNFIPGAGGGGGGLEGAAILAAGHFTGMFDGVPETAYSKNVASLVRTAAGLYTVNFTVPLPNTHCVPVLAAKWNVTSGNNAACFVGLNRNSDIAPGGYSVNAINLRFATDGVAALGDPEEFWFAMIDPNGGAAANASNGALVKLGEVIVTGAPANNLTVAGIPASFRDLVVVLDGKGAGGGGTSDLSFRVNGDTGGNYQWVNRNKFGDSSGAGDGFARCGTIGGGAASSPGLVELTLTSYSRNTFRKAAWFHATGNFGENSGDIFYSYGSAYWRNTAAINSVTIFGSENFAVGTVMTVYGRGDNSAAPATATPALNPIKTLPAFDTWVNQGTATQTINADGTITLGAALDGADNIRGVFRPLPAAPWRYRIGFVPHLSGVDFQNCGIALRDSVSGKIVVFCAYLDNGGSGPLWYIANYNSPTVKSGNVMIPKRVPANGPIYIDIRDDGANRKASFGWDRYAQRLAGYNVASNSFLVPDQIGLIVNNTNVTIPLDMTVFSWEDLS